MCVTVVHKFVTVVPVKESTWYTLNSKSAVGIDWGKGLIFMVSLQTYWTLFPSLNKTRLLRLGNSMSLMVFYTRLNFCSMLDDF